MLSCSARTVLDTALRKYRPGRTDLIQERSQIISLEDLRRVFGLESIKDADGNVVHEAPSPVWANFRQRALDVAITEINANTDLKIKITAIERSKHRRVVALDFAIKSQAVRARTPQHPNSVDDTSVASQSLAIE